MSSQRFGPLPRGELSPSDLLSRDAGAGQGACDDAVPGASLDAAFRSESPQLLRYLRRQAGPDAAPDLLQEVFSRAAGSAQVTALRNPAAFLRRIARNLLIDVSRRRQHAGATVVPLDEEYHGASAPMQGQNIEAQDLLRLYEAALDTLPERTRCIFLMHRVEELSYRQIHERLEISIATVEYHMSKALAHLARAVDAAR